MNSFSSTSPVPDKSPNRMKDPRPSSSLPKQIVLLLVSIAIANGADSDFDGLDDHVETNTGVYVSASNTGTDPNAADTDGDGVPDGLEVKEKTSPVDETRFNSFSKGLVAYWPFDGDINDQSGSKWNGSSTNLTFTNDRHGTTGKSASFDGISSYIELPPKSNLSGDLSASGWIQLMSSKDRFERIFDFGNGPESDNVFLSPSALGNKLVTEFWDTNTSGGHTYSAAEFPSGIWVHFAMTLKSNSTVELYINGKKTTSSTSNIKPRETIRSLCYIGKSNWTNDALLHGNLDDLRIYDRSLEGTEIASIFSVERPRFQIINGSHTWHEAKLDAESNDGRLAVLNNRSKIELVDFLMSTSSYPHCWIGLTDEIDEGTWKWVNGTNLAMSQWASGQPAPSGTEDHAGYYHYPEPNTWHDMPADFRLGYVLERPTSSLASSTTSNGSITGSGEYDPGTPATLTATPNPGYRFTGWTGDASGTENPLTITMDADKTVGATFEKDLTDADADGLSAYDELVAHGTNPVLADTDGDGLSDGYELGIGRFSIVQGSFTWQQARTDARSKGGDLASFPTEDRWNRAMQNLGVNPFEEFTGLWIGASDAAVDGIWTWVNGESFSFAPWGTGRPSSTSGNSLDFAEVSGGGGAEIGKWYDRSPTTIRDGYLLETGYATSPTVADADGDGLNDGQEQTAGTRPTLADTDGDGLNDGQEVNLTQTSPRLADTDGDGTNDAASDQDGDGLGNLAEISTHGTDPRKADTDGDGLSDGAELSHPGRFFALIEGSFTHAQAAADAASRRGRLASFPNANDFTRAAGRARKTTQGYLWFGLSDAATEGTWLWSDGNAPAYARWLDGQPDGGTAENHAVLMENSNQWADAATEFIAAGYLFERVGLDPLATDTDSDGLSDGAEVNTHQTNPVLDDSDSDGLTDGAELNTHGSNPKLADTDGDGLSDSAEVVTHGTNPAAKDSDADGFDDLFEINTGFNPTQAGSTPDAKSGIQTAVKFWFNAGNGLRYRIESSTDLQTWTTVENDIIGTGGVVTRFYDIENQPKRYFRVVKVAGSADPGGDGI